ncbi:MAG: glycosyltransferase family 4 protein [bacterium]|nr:glycosyltransferase family 4 protein [bacterium]
MKSFTILHTESATGFGGQQIRILDELTGLSQKGYRMLLAAPESSRIYAEAKNRSIETFPVPFTRKTIASSFYKILSIIKRQEINIINTHSSRDSWPASVAAKISSRKPKLIRTRHMSYPIKNIGYNRLLYARLPDKIITTGEAIRQQMIETNYIPAEKIVSIPSGINLALFDRTKYNRIELRRKLGLKADELGIGCIALLIEYKGHKYLIDAIEKIRPNYPNIKVFIVGEGPLSDTLKQMITKKKLADRIQLLGFREDIPEVLAALDISVLPSIGTEGVPQVLVQSAAMELPIIATNVGAISEIVQDGINGYLISPRDSEGIAEKIIELISQPDRRQKMGLAGRAIVRDKFQLEQMLAKIETVYQSI